MVFGFWLLVAVSVLAAAPVGSNVYVPYPDLAELIEPADKAVLMDRTAFEALLSAARKTAIEEDTLELGQVSRAEYVGEVIADELTVTGQLWIASMSDHPVAVPLAFGRLGLSRMILDGKPAPLGYDDKGRLTLIVTSRGEHKLEISGSAKLAEIASGGMQFGISIPEAVAGTMRLSAPGDLEMHATAPVSRTTYDKQADRTNLEITLGGLDSLTVVLLGNGRQEDDRSILLGESAARVSLSTEDEVLDCLYTVQVLRRGVRQLQFQLPAEWTVTEVACPTLVRWTVDAPAAPQVTQTLTVRLRSAKVGATTLQIRAAAARTGATWHGPRVTLVDAAFQRGYMLVDTDEGLVVRRERLTNTARQDPSVAALVPGLRAGATGLLYFHWSDDWSLDLELEPVSLRRSIKERQSLVVSQEQVTLTGRFEITAVDRELFDVGFMLDDLTRRWQLSAIRVDGKAGGFEYRTEDAPAGRLLKIELSRPLRPEKMIAVEVVLQHVPPEWRWPSDAPERTISVPLIESLADTVSGQVSISALGDLDAVPAGAPEALEAVPVGRMVSLGMQRDVQHAYSYNKPAKGRIQLGVSRRRPRISADSVGLLGVRPRQLRADWRVTYLISRAATRRLYLLADKTLGRQIKIGSANVPIASKSIVAPGEKSQPLSEEVAGNYDLWQLNLDRAVLGDVSIDVHFERPLAGQDVTVPLVRPICRGQISEQLAIEASEELALVVEAAGAKEIDAIDLPPLPVAAARILFAFHLESANTPVGQRAAVTLKTAVHAGYEVPAALAVATELTTYLDVRGGQRTEANFSIANAGRQFLTVRLPKQAELWSLRVDGKQAKPQRGAGGDYQVALGPLGRPVPVRVVYAYRPEVVDMKDLELGGVELPGVEMNQVGWNVIPPPGYLVTSQLTKMQTRDLARPVPAYSQVYGFLKENLFTGSLVMLSTSKVGQRVQRISKGSRLSGGGVLPDASVSSSSRMAESPAEGKAKVPPPPQAREPAPAKPQAPSQQRLGVELFREGRYTLPVDLVPTPGAGPRARFTGLASVRLAVGLTSARRMSSAWLVGFALIFTIGTALIGLRVRAKIMLVVVVLSLASLLSLWRPGATHFANGAFVSALSLAALYILLGLLRRLCSMFRPPEPLPGPAATAVLIVLVLSLCPGCSTQDAVAAVPEEPAISAAKAEDRPVVKRQSPKVARRPVPPDSQPLIIPYDGDPWAAEESDKVLIPYSRFVKLWNQAHPEETIDALRPGTDISLAAVHYDVTLDTEQMELVLSADVTTYGEDWVVLTMPLEGLAVTESTFDGKPARLTAGPKGMVLMLPPAASGRLRLRALAKPQYLGRTGTVSFALAPLPAAVMEVSLHEPDLQLEADQIEGALKRHSVGEKVLWTVPLGMTSRLTLRWLPEAGGGAADRTLSAASNHDLHAFHWALVAVTRIKYSFSGGEHDRFSLLLPDGATLTDLQGSNLRDFRQTGETKVEGESFKIIQVRLHRPAKKQFELTARWLADLPALDEPMMLLLVRAGDVSRESGAVTLHTAGGMSIKVTKVSGGRRTDIQSESTPASDDPAADRARPVARYYWPYRPFSLEVSLSRLGARATVHLDQLVRINPDRVELLAQAHVKAEQGRLFGADFLLPGGYELLSVVGPAVDKHYERSSDNKRFLHVTFYRGQKEARIAVVLLRRDALIETFGLPLMRYVDPASVAETVQTGRLAVQVAASLEAQTASSGNLKAAAPATLSDWLDAGQIKSVRFAYRYEAPDPTLVLSLRPKPTRTRVEVFAGVAVRTTAAAYTYRLRYTITGSPVDTLTFTLPSEYAPLVAVDCPAMRSVTRSDTADARTKWTVALINEVTGLVDVAVNFALPVEASTRTIPVPRLGTEAADGYRAIIAVQNMSRHEIAVADRVNLDNLDLSEQRKLMPSAMMESLQYVFNSFEETWSLSLDFSPARAAERIQAVVDLLALTTVLDRDGRCRYEAKIAIQNRSEQFLHVDVPTGLRLWSASVADQPVKPVTPADAPKGRVLIPLVKTSPAGLPYDVYLYFADEPDKPLLAPLNGITRIKPAPVSLVGIPVMRTTWSLRLPAGYRYMRPAGNMSRVAGEVEVLSLNIAAKLEQLKRFDKAYRDVAGSFSQREAVAAENWIRLNTRLNREIDDARSFLETNREQVTDDEYHRLSSTLGGQKSFQDTIITGNSAYMARQQGQLSNDLNMFINQTVSNPGVSEVVRNDALFVKPDFVAENERQQIERLKNELQASVQEQQDVGQVTLEAEDTNIVDGSFRAHGKMADDLIVAGDDKEAAVRRMLEDAAEKSATQLTLKQHQLQGQLDALGDNRLQRHYALDAKGQLAQQPQPQDRTKTAAGLSYEYRPPTTKTETDYDRQVSLYANGVQVRSMRTRLQKGDMPELELADGQALRVAGPDAFAASRPLGDIAPSADQPTEAGRPMRPYVARGTYSLPVTLPDGEVRLDFARPSGDARLSIWAVPVGTIRNLYGTSVILVLLLAALALVRIWPRLDMRRPVSAKRIIVYVLLVVVAAVVFGFLGLVLSALVVLVAEALRGFSTQRHPAETAA